MTKTRTEEGDKGSMCGDGEKADMLGVLHVTDKPSDFLVQE